MHAYIHAPSLTGMRALNANALMAAAYFLAAVASLQFSFFHPIVSTVWIPSGIALAAVLTYGPRILWGVVAGVLMLQYWNSVPILGALGITAGCTLSAYCGYLMLTRIAPQNSGLASLRGAASFMVYGAAASPVVAATLGPLALAAAGIVPGYDIPRAWLLWWMGDSLGIMVVTPLLLTWTQDRGLDLRSGRMWQALALIAIQSAAAFIVFHGLLQAPLSIERAIYALIPLAIWLAVGYPLRYTAAGNAALFTIAVLETGHGTGPFAEGSREINLLLLHLFLVIVSFTTLLVAGLNTERTRALRRANQSAERYQRLSELSAEWYWEQDENLRFTSLEGNHHYTPGPAQGAEKYIGKTRWEIPHADISGETRRAHDQLLAEHQPFRDLLVTRFNSNGEARVTCTSGYPVFDDAGRFRGYRGIGRDVTELSHAEKALKASEGRFRDLTALSSDWYWEQDANMRFTFVSGAGHENAGIPAEDCIGRTRFDLPNEFESVESRRRHEEDLAMRRPFRDLLLKRVDPGEKTHIAAISGQPVFDGEGRFAGYRGIGRDVTRLKLAEESLRQSELRYRSLTELSAEWYWEQDSELRFVDLGGDQNRPGVVKDYVGRRRWDLPYNEASDEEWARHKADLHARRPFRDFVFTRTDGQGKVLDHVSVSGHPVFDENGKFSGYRGIGHLVTDRIKIEKALRASEERFRSLTALSSDWYWEQDTEFRITYMSPRYSSRTGLAMKPTFGQTRFDTDNIWESEKQKLEHKAALEAHEPFHDLRLSRYNEQGELHYLSISGEPVADASGRFAGYRGIGRDVTAEVVAQRAVRESEQRFRSLTQLSSDWYWEQDEKLRFTYMSVGSSASADTTAAEFIGKTRFELGIEWESDQARQRHADDLAARRPFRDLLVIRTTPGGERIYARISGKPVFDEPGAFRGYQGTGRNVTAQVLAEQRLARLRDFYAALSSAQSAIIHASNQQALLQEICEVAVTHGRVLFARIGLIDPATGWLETAAVAGSHHDYPYKTRVSVNPDVPEGQGTAGEALRNGAPSVDNDVLANPRLQHWLPHLQEAGILSIAIYPLRRGGRVTGSLHLYASEKNWFDDELSALIHELAANISFALDNFDREAIRQTTEKALRQSEQRFRDIADAAGEFVWENDLEGRFTYLSARVVDVVGYTAEELLGRKPREFMTPEEFDKVRNWLAQNMKPDHSFRSMEHIFISKSGEEIWMQVSGVPTWDEQGNLTGHRGTTRDVTAIKRSEARISYLATRDPLTELPNRLLFNDRLEQGIINARRNGEKVAVLFIDLDRFKNINDSLGHHVGDQLLKEVSRQMADCIRKGDTLSRLGGDEFVVTLEGLGNAEDAAQVARKILATLGKPLHIAGHLLNTTCSMGISIFPNDADDGRELMKNADTAMYHAKEIGRNNFQFFSPEMNVRAVERHQMETELRRALENGEFVLHYQSQADLRTGRLVGMEALIRWQHPERGLVPPMSFIPVAEESGLIEQIGQWALRTACEQNRAWQLEGLDPLKVAVNISARQFGDSRGFAEIVAGLLGATGLDPRYLELEVTESMLLKNVTENVAVLQKLGELGARIAVDDFGTGYSSLAYLKQLPIDTLKIDRTFVRDIETDPDDAAIIQAIIAMAHGLDLRVTAEGVETEGQLSALRRLGCDEYQGYLLAKPLPAAEFRTKFLASPPKISRGRQHRA